MATDNDHNVVEEESYHDIVELWGPAGKVLDQAGRVLGLDDGLVESLMAGSWADQTAHKEKLGRMMKNPRN